MEERRSLGVFEESLMSSANLSVAPIMFSQAITAKGVDSVRRSIPLATTGAINLRTLGPTAHVTYRPELGHQANGGKLSW